jgi:hypothetical protein
LLTTLEFDPEAAVSVTVLPNTEAAPSAARILSISGRSMTVTTSISPAVGVAIQVRWGSYMVLAEVLRVEADQTLTLHVIHILNLDDVAYIAQPWV